MNRYLLRALERAARWLFPATGRHRSVPPPRVSGHFDASPEPYRTAAYTEGHPSALVRPYLLAHEARTRQSNAQGHTLPLCPRSGTAYLGGGQA